MAAFGEVADEVFVRDLVIRGVSHREISDFYRSQYPRVRGLTERSVRRYCSERSIHRISNDELDVIVAEHIRLYGHSYAPINVNPVGGGGSAGKGWGFDGKVHPLSGRFDRALLLGGRDI